MAKKKIKVEEVLTEEWFYDSNNGNSEIRYKDSEGRFHNEEDEPAKIVYDIVGTVIALYFYKHGVIHRDNNMPAVIETHSNGMMKNRWCLVNGKLHNEDSPAILEFDEVGNCLDVRYYLEGEKLSFSEWSSIIRLNKLEMV